MILQTGRRRKNNAVYFFSAGFTLIEILLVLTILAVIAGLTLPNFSQKFRSMRLRQSAQEMAYLMTYAHSRAIVKNRPVRFQLSRGQDQYWLTEQNENSYERIDGRLGKKFSVDKILSLEADMDPIQFYPDGTMDKAEIKICLDQDCLTISTKKQRGRVLLSEQ